MPTKKQAELTERRAEVVAQHGDRCVLCNKGPLQRRALHLKYAPTAHTGYLPMCKDCAAAAKGADFEKHLYKIVLRHARAYDRAAAVLEHYFPETYIPVPKSIA